MSLKFLNLKGWHPSNKANQKRIWIAEQKAKDREQKERDAAAEVRKAADDRHFQQIAAARGDSDAAARVEAQQVGFLYAPPPGLKKVDSAVAQDVAEDDAVREFHRKVDKHKGGDISRDAQRNLERYVGRRPDEMLTIKDQVERFPFLKDAPVEGDYTDSVKVNFKPMGMQLRNVKCIRCGEWGHQSGDRECHLRDFNPHDAARQAREDPMSEMNRLNHKAKQELVLRRASLPLEMQGEMAVEEYALVPSEDDDSPDPEREFLASLTSKEKKLLLKKLKKQARREARGDASDTDESSTDRHRSRRHKHRDRGDDTSKRKHKKHKRKHRHETDTDEDDSGREGKHPHSDRGTHRQHSRKRPRSRSRSRSRSCLHRRDDRGHRHAIERDRSREVDRHHRRA